MERWRGKIALVTGASAGIGADVAARLVGHGMVVYGCARGVDRIEQAALKLKDAPGRLIAVQCDLLKDDEVLRMFERIQAEQGTLHLCVNNAGMARKSTILDGSRDQWREVFEVNVLAVRQCTQEAVKLMKQGKVENGQIVTLNSMSGHRSTSNRELASYQMAKHAVTLMTELTRRELRDLGGFIRIGQISPGMVETEFEARCSGDPQAAKEKYASLETILHAEDITDALIHMIGAPEHVEIHDVLMRPTTQKF
ncbi:dehydrogenase/reductase SDR family member 11-like [Sycon ciliatum]|uniref:dehydrogenase/reductase SDR family member 11-like n=1 Tax=Sycon ciliatum TaxID=27933 RepID=UPI0020ABFF22|eukprot:scpid69992/ scgid27781/ Dehydrogenase/reductase SDR family member 11